MRITNVSLKGLDSVQILVFGFFIKKTECAKMQKTKGYKELHGIRDSKSRRQAKLTISHGTNICCEEHSKQENKQDLPHTKGITDGSQGVILLL